MSEKRFINDVDNGKLYDTKGEMYTIYYDDRVDFYSLWEFLNKLNDENEQLKEELGSFEQVSFTDLCDGSRTVLYMKKENLGDVE